MDLAAELRTPEPHISLRMFSFEPDHRFRIGPQGVEILEHTSNVTGPRPDYQLLVSFEDVQAILSHPDNGIVWNNFSPKPGQDPIFYDNRISEFLVFLTDPKTGKILLEVFYNRGFPEIYLPAYVPQNCSPVSNRRSVRVWPGCERSYNGRVDKNHFLLHENQIVFTGEYMPTPKNRFPYN